MGGAAGIIANPVSALELGELQIDSALGQPLRASISYALNPNEELHDFCIFLNKAPANDLQTLTRPRISISKQQIFLRGSKAINEPMLAMRLTVNCPYTAHLARDYVVMVNPPGTETSFAASALPASDADPQSSQFQPLAGQTARTTDTAVSKPAQHATVASAATARAPVQVDTSPIQIGSDYRVQSGDTLSAIVSRIADRQIGLWAGVDALFHANPDAFVDANRNQLKVGSRLNIQLIRDTGVAAKDDFKFVLSNADHADVVATVDIAAESSNPATGTGVPDSPPVSAPLAAGASESLDAVATYDDDTAVLGSGANQNIDDSTIELTQVDKIATARPGDVFIDGEIPADGSLEAAGAPSIGIPDTRIVSEPARIPAVKTIKAATNTGNASWSWLIWLGGSGLALILGLLLFGRKLRERFGDASAQLPAAAGDNDAITQEAPVLVDVDLDFDATGSGNHTMVLDNDLGADFDQDANTPLDADLGLGTGLQPGVEMDGAEDAGFADTGENQLSQFDLEITAEAAEEPESQPTDIIPPHLNIAQTILDSETGAGSEEFSQYDLSMIVDATRQADGLAAGTTKDLQAVEVTPDPPEDRSNTLSAEADFMILEQDYEDELSATQLLDKEIAKAALELSERMDGNEAPDVTVEMPATADDDASDDLSSELPLSNDSNLTAELTAELATNDAVNESFISDLDDTGIKAELTAELPPGDDLTVDLEIESGTVDTKKTG